MCGGLDAGPARFEVKPDRSPGARPGRTAAPRIERKEIAIAANPRINQQIRVSPVRLVEEDNTQVGIISTEDALKRAAEAGMDLVEVAPMEKPPVCRIMDYGKWKYTQKQKLKTKQHQPRQSQLKEIRIRPKTDTHDRDVKMNRARGFLERNDKVQFTMLFRGRERFHPGVGKKAFDAIQEQLADIAKLERAIKMEGRRMTMVLAPAKSKT